MSVKIEVKGAETLVAGPKGFSGTLKVMISGGGASRSFSLNVPITNASSRDMAIDRCHREVETFGKTLTAQALKERARFSNTVPPLQGNL